MNAPKEVRLNHPIDFMQLTLTYRGPLHAQTNGNTRIAEKHAIRQQFHTQLGEAWRTHPSLEGSLDQWSALPQEVQTQDDPNRFIQAFDLNAYRFIPLITRRLWLACTLDILFLRREPAGHIVDSESGDIDNRIKVLFDALRMPLNPKELPSTASPGTRERPFFCLLENDSLITGFRLESERLLYPPPASEAEVQLTIRVRTKLIKVTWGNLGLA